MKLLFAHDHRFHNFGGDHYSQIDFGRELWNRYLATFQELVVVGRPSLTNHRVDKDRLICSSLPRVKFELFPNLSTPYGLIFRRNSSVKRMMKVASDADAIIARLPSELGMLALYCAEKLKKPWAVEVVSCAWDGFFNYGSFIGKAYAPVAFVRMRRFVNRAPFALYVTEHFLQQRYPSPRAFSVHASNVNIPTSPHSSLQHRLQKIENWPSRIAKLGMIASLNGKFKGIGTVLRAIAKARNRLPPFHFHLLGAGDQTPWRNEAQRLGVQDIVFFDGTLPGGPQVFDWLDDTDIYLQPSFKEGLPRALIEAMSRACPALGSSAGGIPELLHQDDIFGAGNAAALSDLLVARIVDCAWMRERAEMNWRTATRFEHDYLAEKRLLFLNEFRSFASR